MGLVGNGWRCGDSKWIKFLVAGPETHRAHLDANLYIDKSQVRVVAPSQRLPCGQWLFSLSRGP